MCKKLVYLVAFVMLLGVVGSVSADSLVAHWEFADGSGSTATDTSVNTNDGTLNNMEDDDWGQQACLELGSSLTFDGTDEYILVPDDASIDFSTGSFTIAFWMSYTKGSGSKIMTKGSSSETPPYSGNRYTVYVTGGHVGFDIDSGTTGSDKQWTVTPAILLPPEDTDWHHIVCYRDGNVGNTGIYFDGVKQTNSIAGNFGNISSPGEDLYIGRDSPDQGAQWFKGSFGDMRFYDYLLDDAEIEALANYESLVTWCPDPADGAGNISVGTDLSWAIPTDANELTWTYNVYLATDTAGLASATPVSAGPLSEGEDRASLTNAEVSGPLSVGMYYWRVDSLDPNEGGTPVTRTGNVWSFDAGATLPELISPADSYDTKLEINVDLEWSSHSIVDASKIVITPEGGSPIDVGEQTSPFNPYTYGLTDDPDELTMAWNTKYNWQVIELDAGDNVLATGPTWKFEVRALECIGMNSDIANGDCVVDISDFAVLASEWLDCNWNDGGLSSPCP